MLPAQQLDAWHSPLDYVVALQDAGEDCALLYSSMRTDFSGQYSLLAFRTHQEIKASDFVALTEKLSTDPKRAAYLKSSSK